MPTHRRLFRLRETAINLLLCALFGRSAVTFFLDFKATGRPTSLIFVIFMLLLAAFSVMRRYPKETSQKPAEWAVAILSTGLATLFSPTGTERILAGELIQAAGLLITMAGLLSLNRSFALVPANRGIQTTGMYRLVRHPLYMGYLVSDIGLLISQCSFWNVAIAGTAALCFILRIRYEEAFLRRDPDYQAFCEKTRFRLIPKLW